MRVARIVWWVLTLVAGICTTVPHLQAAEDVSKSLKDRLFARYDQKQLKVVSGNLKVATTNGWSGSKQNYGIHYYSFHPSRPRDSWPKQFRAFTRIDEYTAEDTETFVRFTDPVEPGEIVKVRKFYVRVYQGMLAADFFIVARDSKRIARIQTVYADGGSSPVHEDDFGFNFRYYIPLPGANVFEDAFYEEVIRSIGNYLVPADEFFAEKRKAAANTEAQKNVEIKPGMTKAEVFSALGEPQKTITFGEKTYLKYADFTVELVSDKVTDVKTD